MPSGTNPGDLMTVSMTADEAKAWFGNDAPDLSVIGRSRGGSWLYSYLTSFYQDDSGHWNNTVFPDVAMPHVLWNLQGVQTAVFHEQEDEHGSKHKVFSHFELKTPGTQSPEEYAETVKDLVTYLVYMGEPAKLKRESMGIWVLLFLALFTFVAYLLKVEYWKDIH
jgi:ubiquinol-cytochrome c reductase cytochrome c1 subunit